MAGSAGSALTARSFEVFRVEVEKAFFTNHLNAHDWNVTETAKALKMPRSNLYKRLERLGLTREGM